MTYETYFLHALLITLLTELGVALLVLRYGYKKQISANHVLVIFIASLLTLPYFWFILPRYLSGMPYIAIGELCIVIIEAVLYWRLMRVTLIQALVVSLVANSTSIIAGFLIF